MRPRTSAATRTRRTALRSALHAALALGCAAAAAAEERWFVFSIADAPVGSHLARLRIDGIESPIIDRSIEPPAVPVFLDQRVVIT